MAGNNKRKAGKGGHGGSDGKKVKADIHKVGKYLPSGFPIDPKMKGVMVTCARGKETQAGAEACDLLSEVKDIRHRIMDAFMAVVLGFSTDLQMAQSISR